MAESSDDALWAAVGDPSRRRILDALVSAGEATPTALALELPLTRQAVSKHLAVLEASGVVRSWRQGREVRFRPAAERLAAAAAEMTAAAARWDSRLAKIKRLAEAAPAPGAAERAR